jgi:hypothetical protein
MLLIFNDPKSYLRSFGSVIAQLDWAIQKKQLDYPVKSDADLREESLRPDNDNHWNRVRYE